MNTDSELSKATHLVTVLLEAIVRTATLDRDVVGGVSAQNPATWAVMSHYAWIKDREQRALFFFVSVEVSADGNQKLVSYASFDDRASEETVLPDLVVPLPSVSNSSYLDDVRIALEQACERFRLSLPTLLPLLGSNNEPPEGNG